MILVTGSDGQLDAFAIGTRQNLLHYSPRAAEPHWNDLGGVIRQFGVGRNLDGRLEVFAIGGEDALFHICQQMPGGAWSEWASLGGVVNQLAVAHNLDGRLEVFAIGGAGALFHIWQQAANGGWSGWDSLGGVVRQLAVGRHADGRLEVIAVGDDQHVHAISQRLGGWGNWYELAGLDGSLSQLVLGRQHDGALNIFGIGAGGTVDGQLVFNYQDEPGGPWDGWVVVGGALRQLAVGRNHDGRLEVFAVGTDHLLRHMWEKAPGGSSSAWADLGGPVQRLVGIHCGQHIGLVLQLPGAEPGRGLVTVSQTDSEWCGTLPVREKDASAQLSGFPDIRWDVTVQAGSPILGIAAELTGVSALSEDDTPGLDGTGAAGVPA